MIRIRTIFGIIIAGFLLSACAEGQSKVTQVFKDFTFVRPDDFQCPPDSSDRVMIVTQPGRIYSIQNGAVPTMSLLLDLTSSVTTASTELGLLGLTFHPQFKQNGYFYVDYTADNPLRTVIARYTISPPGSNNVILSSRVVLFEIDQRPYDNHKGGCLAFGPDGYLYIGMGDGGGAGDPKNNAQNKQVLLGKILRVDVNSQASGKNYGIPFDNPFRGNPSAGAEEVYAYGLRNPWRFSFDRVTKKLWVGDVGQDKHEEVDTIQRGKNYGWRVMEGKSCYNPSSNCDQTGLELPVWDYPRTNAGGYCVTGGYVYRGKNIPALVGKYVYADWGSQNLWALSIDSSGTVHNDLLAENIGAVTTFGIDPQNELYYCTYDGKIFRIEKGIVPVQEEPPAALFDFRIDQNFPNPFNGETEIPFHIRVASHAVLEIYDMLGRKVATLFDKDVAAGSYTARWNAEGYSSGVYSCRLTAGEETTARMLVLQK